MVLSVSGVVLLAIIVAVLVRNRSLSLWHALASALLGFMLASTGIAPAVQSALDGVAHAIHP